MNQFTKLDSSFSFFFSVLFRNIFCMYFLLPSFLHTITQRTQRRRAIFVSMKEVISVVIPVGFSIFLQIVSDGPAKALNCTA